MTRLSLLLFLFISHLSFGQNNNPTKPQLLHAFRKSIHLDNKGKVLINDNSWIICNTDSSFYKSDTLKLYHASNFNHPNCCNYINWTFYREDAFVLSETQTCKEPTTQTALANKDWFTIKITSVNAALFLETYNQGRRIEKFKVVSIDKTQTIELAIVITLIRANK